MTLHSRTEVLTAFEQQSVPGHESSRFERQGVPEHKLSPLWMTMHQTPTVYINIQHDNTDNNHQPTLHTSTYDLHHDDSTTTTVPKSFMTHFPTRTTQHNDNNSCA